MISGGGAGAFPDLRCFPELDLERTTTVTCHALVSRFREHCAVTRHCYDAEQACRHFVQFSADARHRRDKFRLQEPPTPLTSERHCLYVLNPQFVLPPLYWAHHLP
jgi:hypothetical protein